LNVRCTAFAAFSLTEIGSEPIAFSLELTQVPWTGGAGVFWQRLDESSALKEARLEMIEAIELLPSTSVNGRLDLVRSQIYIQDSSREQRRITMSGVSVEPSFSGNALLRIELENSRLNAVSLSGNDYAELLIPESNQELTERPTYRLGCFVSRSTCTFGNVTIAHLSERN
jgi:hypothetical protein